MSKVFTNILNLSTSRRNSGNIIMSGKYKATSIIAAYYMHYLIHSYKNSEIHMIFGEVNFRKIK